MKHTAGVLRAARMVARAELQSGGMVSVEEMADIIAEETAQPELLDATKQALNALQRPQSYETEQHVANLLEAAIRKAEGEK